MAAGCWLLVGCTTPGAVRPDQPPADEPPRVTQPAPRRAAEGPREETARRSVPEGDEAKAPPRCPRLREGRKPLVYLIGSSTMGTQLGPMLKKLFADWGLETRRWGKASSGLARPDFHDWPGEVPGIVSDYDPDVFVVAIGTNDYQPLKTKTGWIRPNDPAWEREYAARLDRMLAAMNAGRPRTVIWMGPTAFRGDAAERLGPVVNRLMRERVEALAATGRDATFLDAYAATLTRGGAMLESLRLPGSGKSVPARQSDGIHLTNDGVRWLLAEPILERLAPCFGAPVGHLGSDPGERALAAAR